MYIQLSSQSKDPVKVHRVFPSRCFIPCICTRGPNFALLLQNNSVEVVKPFHARRNYPTRNSATLEPVKVTAARLFGLSVCPSKKLNLFKEVPFALSNPWQASDILSPCESLQRPVFLLNSRPHVFSVTHLNLFKLKQYCISRSYPANLQS
jgi:hypothetical protein